MSLAKAKTKVTPKAKAKSKAGGKKQTRNPAKTSAQSSLQKKSAAQKIAVTKSGSRKLQKTSLPQTARSHLNTQARDLALALQAAFRAGTLNDIETGVQQSLMGALIKIYAAQIEDGAKHSIVGGRTALTSTDAMMACHSLLKAVDLQVFDLGVWQSWTGR